MTSILDNNDATLCRKFRITFAHVSLLMFFISLLIAVLSSAVVCGECLQTLSLRYPHRKKSSGLKSGECGGHSVSVFKEMKLSPKVFCIQSITFLAVRGGVALPCWNHVVFISIPLRCKAGRNLFLRIFN